MQSQIRESLAKLERLSQLIPDEDPRTNKARTDFEELNEKFGQLVFEAKDEEQDASPQIETGGEQQTQQEYEQEIERVAEVQEM